MVATGQIRNVVLVGHGGNGKSTLADVLLYHGGIVDRPGRADRGTLVMDHDVEEQQRRQSLALAVASLNFRDHRINLVDTPGSADFVGDALLGMAAADLAVFVIDGVSGVQAQDVALWRHAAARSLPRLVFINKLDHDHASYERTLAGVREAFGPHLDPVELPIGEHGDFHGVVDVLRDRAWFYDDGEAERVDIPTELLDAEASGHDELVEEVVEQDDHLLERYLDGDDPTPKDLEATLARAIARAEVFPVLCGSATPPIGVDRLAGFICRVGPAPGDRDPAVVDADGAPVVVAADPAGAPLALVFKTQVDEFLGQLSLLRVFSGTIEVDDVLVASGSGAAERLHHLRAPSGGSVAPVEGIVAGDIAAIAKLPDTRTGDTLAPTGSPLVVVPPALPPPVHGIAIAPTRRSDEDRLATLLRRLLAEDPTLRVHHDAATGQTVLSGRGEGHLRVALSRLERAGMALVTEDVRVSYRETLAGSTEVEGKYKKQTGGHGQFGIATVRFEPLPIGSGFEFDHEVTGGAIPRNLVPAVAAGIEEAMARGGRHGFPMVDVRAVCTGGKHHAVDSSEMSFKMAGSLALREAIARVGVHVLEPVSELAVEVPGQYQGDVLGDLNSRRAQVRGTEQAGDLVRIEAWVPTSEITRYAIDIRSLTGGTGSFEVAHHGYQRLPRHLEERLPDVAG